MNYTSNVQTKEYTLKQLGLLVDGDWILTKDYAPSGVRLIQVGDVGIGKFVNKSSRYISHETARELGCTLLIKDDILISRMPDPIGRACQLPDLGYDSITAVDVSIWRPDSTIADRKYLVYFFSSPEWFERVKKLASGATRQRISRSVLENLAIPLPPLDEQRRIASRLNEQLDAVESARTAVEEQLQLSNTLINAYLRESLSGSLQKLQLKDGFVEVKKGIGKTWADYPLLGTTRYGVAPAKEKVGKQPERYKLVEPGTIFYNPMRINIGSIGMLDEGDVAGITSPDYVVINAVKDVIHPRWFYYWLRAPYGEEFIRTYARGAVRERMMFTRLAPAYLDVPSYEVQAEIAEKLLGIKQLQSAIESQLAEIESLPASLLREAFTGNIS